MMIVSVVLDCYCSVIKKGEEGWQPGGTAVLYRGPGDRRNNIDAIKIEHMKT